MANYRDSPAQQQHKEYVTQVDRVGDGIGFAFLFCAWQRFHGTQYFLETGMSVPTNQFGKNN